MNNNSDIVKKLENISLKYISKFETSENQFRKFLQKKISNLNIKLKNKDSNAFINNIVNKMKDLNYISDERFSEIKSQQIIRNGGSKKMIILKLQEKGISKSIIKNCIEKLFNNEMSEIAAALIYCKKRKIGIYNNENFDKKIPENVKSKWYGILSRKGFNYDVVKKTLQIKNNADAEDIIDGMKI